MRFSLGSALLAGVVALTACRSSTSSFVSGSGAARDGKDPASVASDGFRLFDADPPQEKAAADLWDAACAGGNGQGCAGMGIVYTFGIGGRAKDLAKGLSLSRAGCEAGIMRACVVMGQIVYFAWGVPKDADAARGYWEKACDAGEPRGCHLLGIAYSAPDGPSAWRDVSAAKVLLRKGCDAGYQKACDAVSKLDRPDRIASLRARVKRKLWDDEPDGDCTAKGLPPLRCDYEGGTEDEDETVAVADGCKHLFPDHSRGTPNFRTYCCPEKP